MGIIILLFLFLLGPKQVAGFISPSTLTLIANSIGSMLRAFLVLIVVNAVLIFKKVKRNLKLTVIISVIFFAVAAFFFLHRYHELKAVNEFGPENLNWSDVLLELGVELSGKKEFYDKLKNISYNGSIYWPELNISVKKINLENAVLHGNYTRILRVHWDGVINSEYFPEGYSLAWKAANASEVHRIMKNRNISKKDKLLIYCYGGINSKVLAFTLAFHGYNADYAVFGEVVNADIVDTEFRDELKNDIFIDSISKKTIMRSNDTYTIFIFKTGFPQSPKGVLAYLINKSRVKFVRASSEAKIHPYMEDDLIDTTTTDLAKSKIICIRKILCFTTIHYLNYINATEIKRIYSVKQ
jgi:hypothetical protein